MDRMKAVVLLACTWCIVISGAQNVKVRLVGDPSNKTGIVEVTDDYGRWVMVNKDYMNNANAKVLCRTLGYSGSGVAVTLGSGYNTGIYGLRTGRVVSQDFQCKGNETDLSQCYYGSPSNWYSSQVSSNVNPSTISCEDTRLRLMDGDTITSGRVEVFIKGDWHTICDYNFDNLDAKVVCSMLGYGNTGIAYAFGSSTFGQGFGDPLLSNLNCAGDETDIKLCRGTWGKSCNHRADAGVKCGGTPIRLVGGSDPASGRVEIKHGGQWGTLCGNSNFEHRDVLVLCRMLGHNNTNSFGYANAFYGEGVGPVLASGAVCDGSETDIAQCSSTTWYDPSRTSLCSHANDIGVNCNGQTKIRLVHGPTEQSGRLEVLHNGHWGTISASQFDDHDLMVVCRMLGFEYSENSFYHPSSYYGSGIGDVVVRNLDCNGNEHDIGQCTGTWWPRTKNEGHANDVGISCDGRIPIRVIGGHSNASGRVEVMHNGHFGTVCDYGFTRTDLIVVCRMLGFENILPTANWHTSAYFGQGLGEIVVSNLNCNGIENTIGKCGGQWPGDTYYCDHSKDVSVSCDGSIEALRLVGSQDKYSGRVEIYHNGEWGRICDQDFDRADAVVICRILGFKNPENAAAFQVNNFGTGNGTAIVSQLNCNGLEDTLEQCNPKWLPSSCSYYNDAAVNCCPSCSGSQIIG